MPSQPHAGDLGADANELELLAHARLRAGRLAIDTILEGRQALSAVHLVALTALITRAANELMMAEQWRAEGRRLAA